MTKNLVVHLFFSFIVLSPQKALSKKLVSDETIQLQNSQTSQFTLNNGLPVVYRKVPDSEIFWISLNFSVGTSSFTAKEAPLFNVTAQLLERGSVRYPKDQLYALFEKYSTGVNCGFGVESGGCQASFINAYAKDILPVFSSLIMEPKLEPNEVELVLQQAKAANLASTQDPEDYVNEVVNQIFYGNDHPYWRSKAFEKKILDGIRPQDLRGLHNKILKKSSKRLIVVGSLPEPEVKKLLEENFKGITSGKSQAMKPKAPKYRQQGDFSFVDRNLPTAYLRAKFITPGVLDKDHVATSLMLHILSEELETEVRTRRSLSYAVYAGQLGYTLGIGILHASTSRPKETLEAIKDVLKRFKETRLSEEDLLRYKNVFATSYFLNLEDHGRLGSSLASSFHYQGNAKAVYEFPRELERVTPDDIRKSAQKYLRQFRLGMVYSKDKFNSAEAEVFLKDFR